MYFVASIIGAAIDPISLLLCLGAALLPWRAAVPTGAAIGIALSLLLSSLGGHPYFGAHIGGCLLTVVIFKGIGAGIKMLRRTG